MNVRQSVSTLLAFGALAMGVTAGLRAATDVVDTREAMVAGINPAATQIWDITNEAMDEDGELDAARMDDEDWARLREAAEMLEVYSLAMANAAEIRAAGPDLVGDKVPEGIATRAEIQAMIDADPEGFRAEARNLAERARLLSQAAKAQDFAASGHRAAEIDVPCQSCHTRYWYKLET